MTTTTTTATRIERLHRTLRTAGAKSHHSPSWICDCSLLLPTLSSNYLYTSLQDEITLDVAVIGLLFFRRLSNGVLKRQPTNKVTGRRASPNATATHQICTLSPIQGRSGRWWHRLISNRDIEWRALFVYHNLCKYISCKYIRSSPNATLFVASPAPFECRIVRGDDRVSLRLTCTASFSTEEPSATDIFCSGDLAVLLGRSV